MNGRAGRSATTFRPRPSPSTSVTCAPRSPSRHLTGPGRCSWPRRRACAPGTRASDRAWLEGWTPGLTPTGYLAGLARYNAVARKLGDEGLALFFDPFLAGEAFGDAHFQDPVHFSPAGSELFAKTLAAFLDASGGPRGPR